VFVEKVEKKRGDREKDWGGGEREGEERMCMCVCVYVCACVRALCFRVGVCVHTPNQRCLFVSRDDF